MDHFAEQIVKQSLDYKRLLIIVGSALGAALVNVVLFLYMRWIFFPILCLSCYGLYWVITSQSWEVEYAVTNGDIDIDRIVGRRSRKTIVRVRGAKIEHLLPKSPSVQLHQYDRVVRAASSPKHETWYFTYRGKMGSTIVLFEPTQKVLDALRDGLSRLVQIETDRALRGE